MKRFFKFLNVISIASLTMLWHGCTADVDLNNIDTSVDVKANIAAPIGSVKANIGDFVGDGTWGIFIDTLKNKGVLTFRDTFTIERDFHQIDLSNHISNAVLEMKVYEQLEASKYLDNGQITGNDEVIVLRFPFTMKLDGINDDENHQRIDSALITNASFLSKITPSANLPLKWEWIEKVDLELGKNFRRPKGNVVTIYEKGDGYGYNQDIPVSVKSFTLNLMKDKNPTKPEAYWNNVVDTCDFVMSMHIAIPRTAGVVNIPTSAAFHYNLDVQFIDYKAIWGMFEPSSDMRGEAEENIAEAWSSWKDLQELCLPLAEPSVDMQVTTQIAGAMIMQGDYLYTKNEQGDIAYAEFDGKQSLYKYFNKNEFLSLNSSIGDSTTMHVLFDKDPARGHIDKLFAIRPDKIGYKFNIDFNRQETPQIRILDNSSIRLDAICDLPMIFNQGISLGYTDSIVDIDLSMLTIDSIVNETGIIDTLEKASATLMIKFENTIPLQFNAVLTCLDKEGTVVLDSLPLLLTNNDTIVIASPTMEEVNHNWIATPQEVVEIIEIEREDLESLRKINKIIFHVWMDDKSLQEAYDKGMSNIKLQEDNYLRVKIAAGANVEGVLNLEF